MNIRQALQKVTELSEDQIRRLQQAQLVFDKALTPMGERFLSDCATEDDLATMKQLLSEWYCYAPPRSFAKSPIDCGDR